MFPKNRKEKKIQNFRYWNVKSNFKIGKFCVRSAKFGKFQFFSHLKDKLHNNIDLINVILRKIEFL